MIILEGNSNQSEPCRDENLITKSIEDTNAHKESVSSFINLFCIALQQRAEQHDNTKLSEPELEHFAVYGPKLKGLTYDSPEYKECLKGLGVALQHHYECNSHHPEYHKDGISDMNLLDLVEMFFDWYAATRRHADGNILVSIDKNKDRFKIDEQICSIFKNTVNHLNF